MRKAKQTAALLICTGLPLLAGLFGSLFMTRGAREWYESLSMPAFTPPDWVFGPAWTALYILMGVAAFLVWRSGKAKARAALAVFAFQLMLNAAWTPVFFGLRSPTGGLVVILPLLAAIAVCVMLFWRVRRAAAMLMIPYLLWVSFALALNISIAAMNCRRIP